MRCTKFQNNRKMHSNIKGDVENMAMTANAGINEKNGNSSKSRREYIASSNHSTPVRQKPSANDAEESPNPNYSPSPILLPCTQDGGNEVAWDWQNTLSRTPNSRSKKQNVQSETPKGTKLFQRKRNSDSPLLCKPLKRKPLEMECIENIGQFAAELQALNEKMRIIKRNDQNDLNDCTREAPTVVNASNEEEVKLNVTNDQENCTIQTNSHNSVMRKSSSYDDLFDDSIDDSMARCTQEIEEKFNLIAVKRNSIMHSQADVKREKSPLARNTVAKISPTQSKRSSEATASPKNFFHGGTNAGGTSTKAYSDVRKEKSSPTRNTVAKISPTQSKRSSEATALPKNFSHGGTNAGSTSKAYSDVRKEKSLPARSTVAKISPTQSKENSEATASPKSFFHGGTNGSALKTYSKLSLKRDANSSMFDSPWKDDDLHKRCLNNNMVHCDTEKSYDDKKSSKDNVAGLFDFPDDSFDDCLATCIEDDKLLPTCTKSDSFLSPKLEPSYKTLTHAPLRGKPASNSTISAAKSTAQVGASTAGSLDNRKFFKFKSLSDHYISQSAIANCKSVAHATFPSGKSASHLNSLPKRSTMLQGTSVTLTSVSTNSIATNDHCKIEGRASSLMSGTGRMLGSDINRSAVKENCNRFVKHNSTGNMRNDVKGLTKVGSLPVRCTAEEIEMKRLQAKMRLEAKRRLYAQNIQNNVKR